MGECANDEIFRVVLEDALGSLMDSLPDILAQDAEYVAAKGQRNSRRERHTTLDQEVRGQSETMTISRSMA